MISWKRNLVCLWLSQFLVLAGFATLIPFIPLVFKNGLHITDQQQLALYISMFNFWGTMGYAAFCPLWGILSDRFGVKVMLLRGTFLTGLVFPLMAYTSNPWVVIGLRFFTSACAGTTASAQIMVAQTVPLEKQGFAQGVLNSAYWSGMMFGNVAGGIVIHSFGYQAGFWLCGILYFLAGFLILFTQEAPVKPVEKKEAAQHSASLSVRLRKFVGMFTGSTWALICLFALVGMICYYSNPYLSIKVERITGSAMAVKWTGIVSAVVCCGSIVAGIVSGYLADRVRAEWLITFYLPASAVALALEGYTANLVVFTAMQTVMFAAIGSVQPVLQKRLSLQVPSEKRGSAFGFATTMVSCGSLLASVIGGVVFSTLSVNWIYYSCGMIAFVSWPLFLIFMPREKKEASGAVA